MTTIARHPAVPPQRRRLFATILLLGLCVIGWPAMADPPAGPPGEFGDFYHSLKQPDTGVGCCSIADCRHPKSRQVADGYEVFIDEATYGFEAPNEWLPVPPNKILQRLDNPTGEPIACWRKAYGIMCFLRGIET